MNIGSGAYTEFNTESPDEMIDMYETVDPEAKMKRGMIHTHHNMQAFFSGTDMDEIIDNAEHYDYYLSLVVNMSGKYVAKIAVATKAPKYKIKISNLNNKYITIGEKEEVVIINLDIELESDKVTLERYNKVKKAYQEAEKKKTMYIGNNHNYYVPQTTFVNRTSWDEKNEWQQEKEVWERACNPNTYENSYSPVTNITIEKFIACLITLDEGYDDTLETAIKTLDKGVKKNKMTKEDMQGYAEVVAEDYETLAKSLLKINKVDSRIVERLDEVIGILERFSNTSTIVKYIVAELKKQVEVV